MDFENVRCPRCDAVVMDGLKFDSGLIRPICPACKHRVWVQGSSEGMKAVRVDKKPSKLPRGSATVAA